jgi:hypothetical protein
MGSGETLPKGLISINISKAEESASFHQNRD